MSERRHAMTGGIMLIGLNGSGKSTVCRELADRLNYKRMDVEDYYFTGSEIPYASSRTKDEVERLMLEEIHRYGSYVMASVKCNWSEQLLATCKLAVVLSAPREVRMERIRQREIERFGDRVLEDGDMYESQMRFRDFAMSRSEDEVNKYLHLLSCPVIEIDSTKPVKAITDEICEYLRTEEV